ncbi:hypothetical protein QE152_g22752 [Popillia japonica]|uniref:BAG family molecular chaperone regulator 2 n=1 Tax=Popillia japonica TaxID=7064 RepID=A0AAW1KKR4_POPJA
MTSTSKYAFEKRYDPQNEKDAEELLEIFANLSDSDIELSDDEGGNMNNDFANAGTEEVRVGADKIGPQTREIVEHLDEEYDEEDDIPLSMLVGRKETVTAKGLVKWCRNAYSIPEIVWTPKEDEENDFNLRESNIEVATNTLSTFNDTWGQMDVDPSPSTSGTDMSLSSNLTALLPKIDEDNIMDAQTAKQKMTEILDMLEGKVEKLRREAASLEEDKDHILASLDSIRTADWILEMAHFEQEETHRYLDRIIDRCLTVDIKIHTQRDQPQEEALHQVNHLIDALVMTLKTDPDGAKEKCVSYMNACSPQHVHGIMDKKFENALLGCTLDDQKRVKKRLQGLLSYLDRLDVTCEDAFPPNFVNNTYTRRF